MIANILIARDGHMSFVDDEGQMLDPTLILSKAHNFDLRIQMEQNTEEIEPITASSVRYDRRYYDVRFFLDIGGM